MINVCSFYLFKCLWRSHGAFTGFPHFHFPHVIELLMQTIIFLCILQILSVFLSTVAGVISLIASVFACIHLMGLLFMACEPQVHLNNTCLCTLSNSTSLPAFIEQQHHYADLQCHELNNFFVFLMIGSCGANLIGALVALWYVYLHWSSRYLYAYTKVQTNAAKESQGTNGTNPHWSATSSNYQLFLLVNQSIHFYKRIILKQAT